jgi:hypothetical protein
LPVLGVDQRFPFVKKTWIPTVLAALALAMLILSRMTWNVYGNAMALGSLPNPFVGTDSLMNCTAVVASSGGHGPCGGAHTMDVMGGIMVGGHFGLKTDNGTLESTMDDYISTYDFGTARVELRDSTSNLVVVGGPGVNQVTWYYNNYVNSSGMRALPVYFDKFTNGTDYIYVASNGHIYTIRYDSLGRVSADFGVVIMFQDGGRHVLILAGLGGAGTWASCKVMSTYEDWSLTGCAAIVRYRDLNGDGFLDTISIMEQVPGTINLANLLTPLSFGLVLAALWPKLKVLQQKMVSRRRLLKVCAVVLLVVASQMWLVGFSQDPESEIFTFKDFSHPFVSAGGLLNCTAVVASSVGHGPCGGAHTMDVMGGIMVGARFGTDATGGSLSSTMDDYISYYDFGTGQITFASLTNNLLVIGGPGVNQIDWYYNNLINASGAHVLPVYFDKFPNGTDYIYVPSTDHYYLIEFDGLGRMSADYGVVTLYFDSDHGWWVMIAAGLGGAATNAASRLLATYRAWSIFGQAIVVKYGDANGDGYLDTITVPELVGVGKSIDVFWDTACMSSVQSIDWGPLAPGNVRDMLVYVRNEGESSIVLSLNVSDWSPLAASNYLYVGWNYSGAAVQPGQVVPILLSLTVDYDVSGVTDFGVNVIVSSE